MAAPTAETTTRIPIDPTDCQAPSLFAGPREPVALQTSLKPMAGSTNLPESVGRYEIRRVVGHGAMGRVLLAHDPVLDRDVAIKMLRTDLQIGPEVRDGLLRRMRHEARAAARVSHPNIVTLHDMIDHEKLGVCLVFELVEGHTLKERVVQGRLPAPEVAVIARQVGGALALAHRSGVLHRDIKPENIMLSEHGAKITDFGIARVPDSTLTRTGGLLGTPAYSAPECISGGNFSDRSDQFSLAATLYEGASGRRAFPGDDAVTVAARIGTEEAPAFAVEFGLPPEVDAVFARALAKKPENRFPDCAAFADALARALQPAVQPQATTTIVDPVPPPHLPPGRPLGHWASVAVGGAFIGALCAVVVVTLARPSPPSSFELAAARDNAHAEPSDDPPGIATSGPAHARRNRIESKPPTAAEPERDAEVMVEEAGLTPSGADAGAPDAPYETARDAAARTNIASDAGAPGHAPRDGGE